MRMRTVTALLLLSTTVLMAQAPTVARRRPIAAVSGAFFALSVADLETSARWYIEKLGLTPVKQGGRMGQLGGFVVLEGGGWIVELIKHDESQRPAGTTPEVVQGIFKAGALVTDFDGVVSALRERGVEIVIGPFPPRETTRANVVFKDNAGNLIQLFGGYAPR